MAGPLLDCTKENYFIAASQVARFTGMSHWYQFESAFKCKFIRKSSQQWLWLVGGAQIWLLESPISYLHKCGRKDVLLHSGADGPEHSTTPPS
jgi:hypothetical protein